MRAGFGGWGKDIEDDILAALDAASKAAPIDVRRVALRGASYGGYSTLMGLIRSPDRFRCGIAASAVSDLPLMFTSSDWSRDPRSRAKMKQIVGDPEKGLQNSKRCRRIIFTASCSDRCCWYTAARTGARRRNTRCAC